MKTLPLLKSIGQRLFSVVLLSALATGCQTQEETIPREPEVKPDSDRTELSVPMAKGPDQQTLFQALQISDTSKATDVSKESVFFDFDSSELTANARSKLRELARSIQKYPKVKIQLEGHADERGTEEYNEALGMERALTVKEFLVAQGVEAESLSTSSHGEQRPVMDGSHPEAWAQNRRVELFEK